MPAPAPERLLDREYRLLLVGVVCLITVVAVEAMAISTVMPLVEEDLGDLWLYGWVFSAFYLGTLVGVVAGGRTADRVAPVVPMVTGVGIFLVGLVVGGLAPTMAVLVAGRFLQGLGAGVVPAVAYVCVGRGFPAALRPRVFAVMSTAWVLPSLISPLAAAEVAETFGWRWVFLGLIPVVIAVAALGVPAVRSVPPSTTIDPGRVSIGSILVVAIGAALVLGGLALDQPVPALLIAGTGAAVILPAYRALTPSGTLRARPVLPATVLTRGVVTYAFFSADAFVSLSMVAVRGTTARTAGLALASASLAWTAGSWIQARFSLRWGPARLVRLGGSLIGFGVLAMALALWPEVPIGVWVVANMLSGLGMGLAYTPLSVLTLAEATPGAEGRATSALQMSDILGVALGTGLAGVIVNVGDRWGLTDRTPLLGVFAVAAMMAVGIVVLAGRLRQTERRLTATPVP